MADQYRVLPLKRRDFPKPGDNQRSDSLEGIFFPCRDQFFIGNRSLSEPNYLGQKRSFDSLCRLIGMYVHRYLYVKRIHLCELSHLVF